MSCGGALPGGLWRTRPAGLARSYDPSLLEDQQRTDVGGARRVLQVLAGTDDEAEAARAREHAVDDPVTGRGASAHLRGQDLATVVGDAVERHDQATRTGREAVAEEAVGPRPDSRDVQGQSGPHVHHLGGAEGATDDTGLEARVGGRGD